MSESYYVYIMASRPKGATYIGMTSNLTKRVFEHREALVKGYTSRFNIKTLVYYETYEEVHLAIEREKKLKKWKRQWKFDLIESFNPKWDDLYHSL